jgi:hypothetical protein
MKRRAGWIALSVLLLAAALGAPAFAEEDWRQFIISDVVGYFGAGASSRLVEDDDWGEYAPGNLIDGNKDSAWVEGVEGDGVGRQVWFTVDRGTTDLVLANGFARSASLFKKHNRVKRLAASLWVGATADFNVIEQGRVFRARPASARLSVLLADKAAPQTVALPFDWGKLRVDPQELIEEFRTANEYTEEVACWTEFIVCLEIREVYRGTANRDTCIAEVAWTLPRAVAGPDDRRAADLAGYWKAEAGAEWDFLHLELKAWSPRLLQFITYLEDRAWPTGQLYEEDGRRALAEGQWYVGDGKLTLESDAGRLWVYTDGRMAGDTLVLVGEDGHREAYVRAEEEWE